MKELRGLHLHLEPTSGIAGDMTVAALVDAGVPRSVIAGAVAAMGVRGLRVRFETRKRGAFVARGFVVEEPGQKRGRAGHAHTHEHAGAHAAADGHGDHHHRDYAQIRRLLSRARLDPDAKALAEDIFARLATVEAMLHGVPEDRVAFHEVGAFDSIADIVGMAAGIAWLAPASIGSSAPVVGTGMVRTAHGIVPVPAPATAALLVGIPMVAEGPGELTTPTGAAFLAAVVDSFGPPPPMKLAAVGYGAGTRVIPDRANVLRVMLGRPIGQPLPAPSASVMLVESNIDDMNGQLFAALADALRAAGAVDVWTTPILMKKGRPAQQISALVGAAELAAVQRAFFLHSTTLGVRVLPVSRVTLPRSIERVSTPYGPIAIKVAGLDGELIGAQPEYDDCQRAAAAAGVPVRRVWTAALAAAAALGTVSARVAAGAARRQGGRKGSRKTTTPDPRRSRRR
jgi:uncharacterized protein (TIGR00299 family) protein